MSTIKTITLILTFFALPVLLAGCGASKSNVVKSHLNNGDYQKALKEANKALKKNPDDKMLVYRRGQAKKGLERYDGAIQDFRKTLKLNEDDDWAKWPAFRMGQVNMERERYQEAIDNFTSALNFKSDFTRALAARAEAKSTMGDEVGAEEDRQLVRKIKERRKKRRRQRAIKREREELMEHWNEATGGAPLRNYEIGIGGVESGPDHGEHIWRWSPVDFGEASCEDHVDSFDEVDQKLSELGGRLVSKERAKYDVQNAEDHVWAVWKFTWWYDSHPEIRFNWHHEYRFDICDGGNLRHDPIESIYDVHMWGHDPDGYTKDLDYEENREIFPVDGSYPVCEGCE